MEYPDNANKRDVHLRFKRPQGAGWEQLPSTNHFVLSQRIQPFSNGTIYVQGILLDSRGKELSLQQVASLIDAKGPDAIYQLEGDFVIAVDDKRHGVWCATDPSATFPIFYKLTRDELVITTRAENMSARSADDLDIEGIVAVLSSGYPWGDMTLLKHWKTLRPGHVIRIDSNDNASVTSYFEPETAEDIQGYQSPEDLVPHVDESLKSIGSRFGKILLPLSGGIDSRLVAVRCHALGIPFEAITFVADDPNGADFDVAKQLVKVFGVKHYRWQWEPSPETCLKNFEALCCATAGTNDAYTSYPDGMRYFADVASEFDCIIRGDHVFGMGPYSQTLAVSAWLLNIRVADQMDWALRPEFRNRVTISSIFERQEGISTAATGDVANAWRHMSYRKTRSPRYILPIGQLQGQFTTVTYPFLSKEIVSRVSRTNISLRDGKRIAHEALAACSPPDIKRIPFAHESTWHNGEPLLSVAPDILKNMIEMAERPGILSDIVDASVIIENYKAFLNGSNSRGPAKKGLLRDIKKMIKSALPARVRAMYDDKVARTLKLPPYMTFKRFFAMKVYLDRISQGR